MRTHPKGTADMEVYKGRPADDDIRLKKEIAVYDFLDRLNIEYLRVDHEAANTMEACKEIDLALENEICKNLLLCNRQQTDFYLLMMPGDKVFKTKDLSKQIGSARLSFADGKYMEEFLNISPGSLSVMGLIFDKEKRVRLLIDHEIIEAEYIGCHPCINTSSLKIRTKDILEKVLPETGHEYTIVELPIETMPEQ